MEPCVVGSGCTGAGRVRWGWWPATVALLFLGSLCYVMASYYHLTMGERWSFRRAYTIALFFVAIEYIFNVMGSRRASERLTAIQMMVLIFALDLIALLCINAVFLHNPINMWRDGLSVAFLLCAMVVSTQA